MNKLADLHLENANLWVLVLDFETLDCEEVVATDFSRSGCRVQSKRLKMLDQAVGLRVSGVDKMIKGRVSEILDEEVVVRFEFNDEEDAEKRKERRRSVSIPARVYGAEGEPPIKCRIVDASLSGCRLASDALPALPDDITLKIKGIDLPVQGKVAWRGAGVAGVRMLWDFSGKNDLKAKTMKKQSGSKPARKKRASSGDFGIRRTK